MARHKVTGLSGNAIYYMQLKGLSPGQCDGEQLTSRGD
jgi:hypothetical protein